MPLELSGKSVVAKLRAYFEWGKADARMVAINPWHFNRRRHPQNGPPCDMELGAADIPGVVVGLYPIVTFQYRSTTLYKVSYHIQYLFFESDNRMLP